MKRAIVILLFLALAMAVISAPTTKPNQHRVSLGIPPFTLP